MHLLSKPGRLPSTLMSRYYPKQLRWLALAVSVQATGCAQHLKLTELPDPASPYVFIKDESTYASRQGEASIKRRFDHDPARYLDHQLRDVLDATTDARSVLIWDYDITVTRVQPSPYNHPAFYQAGAIGALVGAMLIETLDQLRPARPVDRLYCHFRGRYFDQWFEVETTYPICPEDNPNCVSHPDADVWTKKPGPEFEAITRSARQCIASISAKVAETKAAKLAGNDEITSAP